LPERQAFLPLEIKGNGAFSQNGYKSAGKQSLPEAYSFDALIQEQKEK